MIDLDSEVGSEWSGDLRIQKRLGSVARAINKSPGESFPKIFTESDELEAFYRLLRNENVFWRDIFSSHVVRTCERMEKEPGDIICVSDTTTFSFRRENGAEDIGYVGTNKAAPILRGGFLGHFAFATSLSGKPLGVVGLEPIRRKRNSKKKSATDPTKESGKWWNLVEQVRRNIGDKNVIHVMDSEADVYEHLSQMVDGNERFVVRMGQDRAVKSSGVRTISEVLDDCAIVATREVVLSKRKKKSRGKSKRNITRGNRTALLSVQATSIEIKCPPNKKCQGILPTIRVNLVHVFENQPPEGCEPVDWKLTTSEPIGNEQEILRIVDIYRKRWGIEEYFKALKTGCSFEKRELQSYKTLLNALAILVPVAYRLLLIRHMSRANKQEPAANVLTRMQLKILKSETKKNFPDKPTIKEVMLAIAKLGGHITNNGAPGWIVLGRGYDKLLMLERGYALAVADYERMRREM